MTWSKWFGVTMNLGAMNLHLIASLSSRIDSVLGSLVPAGTRCALVDYPDHWNAGDSAIWLGTLAALDRLGAEVSYQCEWRTYSAAALSAAVDGGPILIAGGGNLGDLWPISQGFRERVLHDFPENPIIQLPQSVWFEHEENVERFRRLCEAHANFHLVLRDEQSLELAGKYFEVPTSLCPDMAFALGTIDRPAPASIRVFWLSRRDKESRGHPHSIENDDIECRDWTPPDSEEPAFVAARGLLRRKERLKRIMQANTDPARRFTKLARETFEPLARLRLDRGCRFLSRGQVVITDRLHGHILCLCMGIPHVVLDNSYGKVRSFYEAWTSASSLAQWANSVEEALEIARSLLEGR